MDIKFIFSIFITLKHTLLKKILILLIAFSMSIGLGTASSNFNYENAIITPQNSMVFICMSSNAYAYHDHYCQGLNRCTHDVYKITVSEAVGKGYKACGYCY
jgi:hypothetical protein